MSGTFGRTWFQPGSKAPRIIELYKEGMMPADIARVMECSRVNVNQTIRRHFNQGGQSLGRSGSRFQISVLSREDRAWLMREARRLKTPARDLARAMLIDAIAEAREAQPSSAPSAKSPKTEASCSTSSGSQQSTVSPSAG